LKNAFLKRLSIKKIDMKIDDLFTKDTANSEEYIFPLPAFALLGNWNFGQYFKTIANAHCTNLQNTHAKP
jgi:hypothetical protein